MPLPLKGDNACFLVFVQVLGVLQLALRHVALLQGDVRSLHQDHDDANQDDDTCNREQVWRYRGEPKITETLDRCE